MGVDEMFSGKKTFTIIAMIVLLVGFIGDLIVPIMWWTRIQPWFSHGLKEGKTVYQCVLACWVLSLIGTILLIVFLILTFFVQSVCDSITGNTIVLVICFIVVGGVSVGCIVSGIYGSTFAVKNPSLEDFMNDDDSTVKNKCYKYLTLGIAGATEWAIKNGKLDDLMKRLEDIGKHLEKNGKPDYSYLCVEVGIPTLVFSIVQVIGLVLFVVDIILSCSSFSRVG